MLRMAAAHGTTEIIATPHADERYRFDAAAVEWRLAELRAAAGGILRIHYGCEMHLTPENLAAVMRAPAEYTIGHRAYLLVEFSNRLVPRNSREILARLMASGLRPIVAHPERNPILRERMPELERWVNDGCLLQVTGQALLGNFGGPAEEAALELLADGLAHCVASDAHDVAGRPPLLNEARRLVEDIAGAPEACRLFDENPRAIVNGAPIVQSRSEVRKKSWYTVW